jgi:AcrR family transcriptional regulator
MLETWELLSYVVTVIGLPLAIAVYLFEKHQERINDEEDVYERLSRNYQDFLQLALDNPDLKLLSRSTTPDLSPEQQERMQAIFAMLIALFERAFILLYDKNLKGKEFRRWSSWQDFMQEWCERDDFRNSLPDLVRGEDPEFSGYIKRLAETVRD